MRTYADGQLAASAATIFTAGQDANYPSAGNVNVSLTLSNTSGVNTETVVITMQRQGGTARRVARVVLAPNETAIVSGIAMQMGDVLLGSTTDATTVDYVLGESGPGFVSIQVYNSTGAGKAVASTDGTLSSNLTQSVGASTAAAGSTTADAGVLPAATSGVYPTTAADDTKGVRIHASDKVTGRRLFIGNGVANKILKVYPPSGGTINGAAADAAFSSVSGASVDIVCQNAGANTWLAEVAAGFRMATNKDLLEQALAANIAALAKLSINPRPDGSVDGTSNQWSRLRMDLLKEQKAIREQLQQENGPFEVVTYPPGS